MSQSSFTRHNAFSLLGMQASLCTESEVRSKCVQELLTSEQDYLKTLRDVIEVMQDNVLFSGPIVAFSQSSYLILKICINIGYFW